MVVVTSNPDELWQIDITYFKKFTHNGYKYILTIIDHFSKYAWAIAMKKKKTANTIAALERILKPTNGSPIPRQPKRIQSDNGKEFKDDFDIFLGERKPKIAHAFSTPYAAQTNGLVEGFNKTLKRKLVGYMTSSLNGDWPNFLQLIVKNYNNTKH